MVTPQSTSLYIPRPDVSSYFGRPDVSQYFQPAKQETSWFGQTVGAFEYSAADIGEKLLKFVGATETAQSLADFKLNHPDYAPEEVDSVWDLITNPRALVGRISSTVPQLLLFAPLMTGGAAALGLGAAARFGVGAALGYALESQRGRDQAIADGASESEVEAAAVIKGTVGAALNVIPFHLLSKLGAAGKATAIANASAVAGKVASRMKLTGSALRYAATQAAFGAAMPLLDEGLSAEIYGKPVSPGLLDRVLQGAVGNAVAMSVFGYGKTKLDRLRGAPEAGTDATSLGKNLSPYETQIESTLQILGSANINRLQSWDSFSKTLNNDQLIKHPSMVETTIRDVAGFTTKMAAEIPNSPVKTYFMQVANDSYALARQVFGEYWGKIKAGIDASGGERAVRKMTEPTTFLDLPGGVRAGWSKWMVDNDASSPGHDPTVNSPLGLAVQEIRKKTGDIFTGVGGAQKLHGVSRLFEPTESNRFIRKYSDEVRSAVERGDRWVEDLATVLSALNPKSHPTVKSVRDSLQSQLSSSTENRYGYLEFVREFKVVPDVIVDRQGNTRRILDVDPVVGTKNAILKTIQKSAQVRMFGQEGVKNPSMKKVSTLLKDLGVPVKITPRMVLAELVRGGNGGYFTGFDVEDILLNNRKITKELTKQIVEVAKFAGVPTKPTSSMAINRLSQVDPSKLTNEQVVKIRKVAKDVGGLDLELDTPELLDAISGRLEHQVVENGIRKMIDAARPYGKANVLEELVRVWQGKPLYQLGDGPIQNAVKLASSALGATQTSLSGLVQPLQPLMMGPRYLGGFVKGGARLIRGLVDTFADYKGSREKAIAMGVLTPTVHTMIEHGWVRRTIDGIQRFGGTVSGARFLNEFNNVWMAMAGKRMMEDWAVNGIRGKGSLALARDLGFSPEEIAHINSGPGLMTNFQYRKGIQKLAWTTQYQEDAPFNKSRIANHPLLRMAFAYNSYAEGTLRNVMDVGRQVKEVFTGKGGVVPALSSVMTVLSGAVGVGMANQLLRAAAKGNLQQWKNEDVLDRGMKALAEVALLGPTQRMLDAFHYDRGMVERAAVGMMPQVSAITQYLGALLGYGQYGKFSLDKRLWEAFKTNTPMAKGIDNWVNTLAYPEVAQYREARAAVNKFSKDVLKVEQRSSAGLDPIDPDYYKIFQEVVRGDVGEAQKLAMGFVQRKLADQTFVQDAVRDGIDPTEKAVRQLRSSLTQRRPINLALPEAVMFLKSVTPSQRQQFMQTYASYQRTMDQVAPNLGGGSGRSFGPPVAKAARLPRTTRWE